LEIDRFMELMRLTEVKKTKEISMEENSKEIHIKAVKKADDRVSLMDMEGNWYSGWRNQATPESWELLSSLKNGDRADIKWTVNPKGFKNLTGLTKVLRPQDEVSQGSQVSQVKPVMSIVNSGGLSGETFPERQAPTYSGTREESIERQVCLKGGIEIVSAQIKSGDMTIVDPVGNALAMSIRLYQGWLDLKSWLKSAQ
jgi:hypothetical protein